MSHHKPVRFLAGKKVEIPSDRYLADLELHDRYQDFSAELLKLSLGGIAAFGIVLGLLGDKDINPAMENALRGQRFVWTATFAVFALVGAAAFALLHRFLASDGMYHHLRAIKLLILLEKPAANPKGVEKPEEVLQSAHADEAVRNKKFKRAGWYLAFSAWLLALAGALLCVAFTALLKSSPS